MASWDWYQATIRGLGQHGHDEVLAGLVAGLDLASAHPAHAKHGYLHGAEVRRGSVVLARVWWGGNPGVHVQATGQHAAQVSALLRERWPRHSVVRADAREDWREPGLFDRLSGALIAYALDNRITIDQAGDWARGEGRTLYLGSPSSAVRLLLYEKGYEVGGNAPRDWVRLEVRIRPKGDAREAVATWEPGQAFGASAWLIGALSCIGWDHLSKQGIGTVWRAPDHARARRALVEQYGATIRAWIDEAGSPDRWRDAFEQLASELAGT